MTKIQEIEQQLAQAKKEEQTSYLNIEFEQIKKQYEGKCLATHGFERNAKTAYSGAVYYEKFYIEDGKIYVSEWSIRRNRVDKFYKFSSNHMDYNRFVRGRCISGNGYNPAYNLGSFTSSKIELSLSKFMEIWSVGDEVDLIINEAFSSKVKNPNDLLRIGTSSDEDRIIEALKETGIKYIDVTLHPKLFQCIQYARLPFFHEQRWLPKIYAKQCLEYAIKLNTDRMSDNWTAHRMYEALAKDNETIQNFINTL